MENQSVSGRDASRARARVSTRGTTTVPAASLCYSLVGAVRPNCVWVFTFVLAFGLSGGSIVAAQPSAAPSASAAEAARVDRQRAEVRAAERRRIFIGVVGFAALVFGLTGLLLVRRSRRNGKLQEPEPSALAPVVARVEATSAPPAGKMVCPTCREEYEATARFCKSDGNRLVPVREGVDPRAPTGGICPVCAQGYDPGVPVCPVHQEELVPAGLAREAPESRSSYPKICPTCGVQYSGRSGFCGADGSALVTIN